MLFELFFYLFWVVVGGLVFFYVGLYFWQEHLLFHPRPIPNSNQQWITQTYPHSDLNIRTADGIQLHGWLIKPDIQPTKSPLIIYFGGNTEEMSGMSYHAQRFGGWAVLLINYRGFGLSAGKPSEKSMLSDAITIFDTISKRPDIDLHKIVVMGRSLGSGIAVHLAAQRPLSGIILVTPYDSITRVAQRIFPYVPISLLLKHPFNSLKLAPKLTTPMLALVAQQDILIPPEHAYHLVEAWQGIYEFKLIEQVDHITISDIEIYWETIRHFLARIPFQNKNIP
jgi:hypothetical protein